MELALQGHQDLKVPAALLVLVAQLVLQGHQVLWEARDPRDQVDLSEAQEGPVLLDLVALPVPLEQQVLRDRVVPQDLLVQ